MKVLFEKKGPVAYVTINRPERLNACDFETYGRLSQIWREFANDSALRVAIFTGAGDRAFCAGGDIRSLYESGQTGTSYALDFYRDEYILNATIKHYPKPYIALIHGIVMGGGVGVSVHGAARVASETTTFAMPETGIGLFPDVGGSFFLPRCPGELGMYLALTGARLKTADCLYAGVATHFVPAAQWEALIQQLAAGKADAVVAAAQKADEAPLSARRSDIDRIFAGASVEAILSALDKDDSEWAAETAKTIRSKSPTATKLAFRQIREGKKIDFDDCMRMEFRMVNRVVAGKDFYEGVRATIIDKDQAPKWQPARLEDVSDKDIDAYFAPLGDRELKL